MVRAAAAPGVAQSINGGQSNNQQLYNGAGEGMQRAFELALTPAIIGGFGYLLDRWLGLLPVLTIIFFLVAMAGVAARMYYSYDADMKQHEAAAPWAPSKGRQ